MSNLIESIKNKIKSQFENQEGSHDLEHILRVYNLAVRIQSIEGGDKEVVELGALLHDISDHKYNGGDFDAGWQLAHHLILENGGSEILANKVADVVKIVSFKGALVKDEETSIEGKIVRDADRLDAIGAIGIARTFAYGGSKNQALFLENTPPVLHESKEAYFNSKTHTINHFYEKLLLLKDRMETNTAKEIALVRHNRMLQFITDFMSEINSIS
jgi:uncharacterized protein